MSFEDYLSNKLSRFSMIEYVLVMLVYFTITLLIASFYKVLLTIGWWFDLLLVILCAFPLVVHLISQPGNGIGEKIQSCLKNNTPALQILLFLTMFFFALMLSALFPILTQGSWWIYVVLMIVLAIQPLRTSWIW
ncbi:hypothetical protein [Legionella sp. W05-934-2]|jgi:hypothetical protein|uniref:hypothetical protein n=1 Tax=Legionella sp. W05-934-2 TaxID=1198649 RepID=UPI0034617D12